VTSLLARHLRAVTWLLLFVGVGGSVIGAADWRSNQRQETRHSFDVQASVVTSSVALSLARLDDLTATMRAALSARPHMTSRGWERWSADLDVTHRYPGSLGLAFAQVVPASQLANYEATVESDPPAGATGKTPFAVVPPGARPMYCFIRLRSTGSVLDHLPIGLDLCQVGGRGFFSKPRDTGEFHVTPVALGGASVAAIFAPVYRGGLVPVTIAARRARFIGLVGGLFNVEKLLGGALRPYFGLSATLSRQDIGSSTRAQSAASGVSGMFGKTDGSVVGSFGAPPARSVVAHTKTFDSDGEWTITVAASEATANRRTTTQALFGLFIGLILTFMAFALLQILVRGRQRALDLVESRTAELSTSESRFRSLAAASSMGILETDVTGHHRYGNRRLERLLGRTVSDLADLSWLDSFSAVDRDRVLGELHGAVDGPTNGVDVKIEVDGTARWVRFTTARMVKDGKLTGFVSSLEDVTIEIASTERLKAEAQHDSLTGLPNRAYFLELLAQALRELDEQGGQFAVLFIDLDRFKQVNDTHGHAVGDELLVATAERIAHSLRPGDRVARLGGDEFAVLMTQIDGVEAAAVVVDRLQLAVARPFNVAGTDAIIGASVGMVLVDDPIGDPASILQDADMAMYRAKDGSTRFEVFDVALRTSALARFETEQALRGAVGRHELLLCYQPVITLHTGEIAGGEALMRWRHPARGLLAPGEFLPLAESTGLIVPIGDWTIRTAVGVAASWPPERGLSVSVNLSAQQLTASNLLATIEDLLIRHSIAPDLLCVEVLETHLLDNANISVLGELKRLGIRIAIDDFGSGYSSLLYLKRMAADVIKVDRALVTDLPEQSDDRIIVAKVIELAHELGMSVVAEGVERGEQADILRDLGCDLAQGFLWAPAVLAPDFEALLGTGFPVTSALAGLNPAGA
jgi:diguanylate cyclase (GGDEF)-like protein/PAS domain S-box-containing protein